jgi:hypothetical protein
MYVEGVYAVYKLRYTDIPYTVLGSFTYILNTLYVALSPARTRQGVRILTSGSCRNPSKAQTFLAFQTLLAQSPRPWFWLIQ